jgi:benzoate-CoA ligase
VLEVAVVGVPDEAGLDKPVAVVVPRTGASVQEEDLVEFCRAGLASFKRPRRVLLVDSLPKTATGKLQRYLVRATLSSSFLDGEVTGEDTGEVTGDDTAEVAGEVAESVGDR